MKKLAALLAGFVLFCHFGAQARPLPQEDLMRLNTALSQFLDGAKRGNTPHFAFLGLVAGEESDEGQITSLTFSAQTAKSEKVILATDMSWKVSKSLDIQFNATTNQMPREQDLEGVAGLLGILEKMGERLHQHVVVEFQQSTAEGASLTLHVTPTDMNLNPIIELLDMHLASETAQQQTTANMTLALNLANNLVKDLHGNFSAMVNALRHEEPALMETADKFGEACRALIKTVRDEMEDAAHPTDEGEQATEPQADKEL